MKQFLFVSHTTPPTGDWGLDDLAGDGGRVDVLCRGIQAAMFLSHGLRGDVQVILAFVADPDRPTAIRLSPGITRLNPDERSTAARIRTALRARPEDPWWDQLEPGIEVSPFTLPELASELEGSPVILDKDGAPLESATLPDDPIFIIGDHKPLSTAEMAPFTAGAKVSLGPIWYHGNHVASILHYTMDRGA